MSEPSFSVLYECRKCRRRFWHDTNDDENGTNCPKFFCSGYAKIIYVHPLAWERFAHGRKV